MAVRRLGAVLLRAVLRGAMVQITARRWMPPTIVYSAAVCVVGLPFVIMRPGALRWAPSFVVLARLSFLAAWLRRERSLWGNDGQNR